MKAMGIEESDIAALKGLGALGGPLANKKADGVRFQEELKGSYFFIYLLLEYQISTRNIIVVCRPYSTLCDNVVRAKVYTNELALIKNSSRFF